MKVLLTATVQSHICQFHKPLVQVLNEYGCEVHVAARNNLAEKNGLTLDFADKVYDIPFARSPKSLDNLKAYKQLKKIIETEEYDVVHCNTPMGGIVTRLAANKMRKKGTKVFYTAHGFHFYKGAPKKNWIVFYPIEKIFSRITDKLVTITAEDYKLAKNKFHSDTYRIHGVGVNSSKFVILSNEEKEIVRKELGYTENTKIILNVGELLPNKNQKTAIAAMEKIVKQYPDSKLLIAGNGKEKGNLENLIRAKGLVDHVTMLGYTTQIQKYMNVADVLIACSHREGMPVNLMEAMLCKKPIVASINRGHRELISDGKNGYLVERDDAQAYADRICGLLENDAQRELMGNEGYRIVADFTDTSVKKELQAIYEF